MAKGTLASKYTMDNHLRYIGMPTKEIYFRWCTEHGFRCTIEKTMKELNKEVKLAKSIRARLVLAQSSSAKKGFVGFLKRLKENVLIDDRTVYSDTVDVHKKLPVTDKDLLIDFLSLIDKKSKLLKNTQDHKTILQVFSYKDFFVRDWEEWSPKSHNLHKQLSSLVRHLFAKFDLPVFMDNAWITRSLGDKHIDWFFEIGNGTNIRKCKGLPFTLTKKMAHCFTQAPDTCSIEGAFRWARITALGGDERLFRSLEESVVTRWEDHHFIESVITFFIDNPMLDRAQVGPIVDYINQQKYISVDVFENNRLVSKGPEQPNFSMNSRSPEALLEHVERWHRQLGKERKGETAKKGVKSGVSDFQCTEGHEGKTNFRVWRIQELLSSSELRTEGRAMRNCVASYSYSCLNGRSSIWSMTLQKTGALDHRNTIELDKKTNTIVQVRARCNAKPPSTDMSILNRWASKNNLTKSRYLSDF